MMKRIQRSILSLLLMITMALTAVGAGSASADEHCAGMKSGMMAGMTDMAGMMGKSDPCQKKAPECMDMSGCILAAARLAEPLDLKHPIVWSTSVYSLISADIPSSMDIRPDHSPPRSIA